LSIYPGYVRALLWLISKYDNLIAGVQRLIGVEPVLKNGWLHSPGCTRIVHLAKAKAGSNLAPTRDPFAMQIDTTTAVDQLTTALTGKAVPGAELIAQNTIWLEACGYPGLKVLTEALEDGIRDHNLVKDALGLDLKNVSCVFLADKLCDYVLKNGRIYLRNVRHGLFLLPASVESGYGIGCPVDPAFALGGERTKDPYVEKLELAARDGITLEENVWALLTT
jgi:hypothetical protein